MNEMSSMEMEGAAAEEARRLYEKEFFYHNPYTREIDTRGIPSSQKEAFCQLVEEELLLKGEKIHRSGEYFKIERYQAK